MEIGFQQQLLGVVRIMKPAYLKEKKKNQEKEETPWF
jgi:hypothetical protein